MESQDTLREAARLRLRFQMNNRLRLESLAALSKVFRDYGEPVSDDLLASLTFAVPTELQENGNGHGNGNGHSNGNGHEASESAGTLSASPGVPPPGPSGVPPPGPSGVPPPGPSGVPPPGKPSGVPPPGPSGVPPPGKPSGVPPPGKNY